MAAATILEVNAEFVHIPRIIICNFGDQESHFVEVDSQLDLGKLYDLSTRSARRNQCQGRHP